jgi:hypothetical protein
MLPGTGCRFMQPKRIPQGRLKMTGSSNQFDAIDKHRWRSGDANLSARCHVTPHLFRQCHTVLCHFMAQLEFLQACGDTAF